MGEDLCGLVRRDHDDIDHALEAMIDPRTPPRELIELVEIFRLALAVHTATEAHVTELLMRRVSGPRILRLIATHTRIEHSAQHAAAEAMRRITPGSLRWYEHALGLRRLVLDHASRAERARSTLDDHVPSELRRVLASEYAAERLRVLGCTSPLVLAQRRHWVASLH